MRLQQHLGIVGAICSSLLLSCGAICLRHADANAQTTNTTPSGIDAAEMERICTEYMNTNGTQTQQSNRPGGNTTGTGTGTNSTTASRNTAGTGTTGTTTSRNATGTGTTGTTTSRNATGTGTTGTTTSRNTTGNTDTGTRGVESFTPEQLDRMCANFMNDSNTSGDRNPTSPKPGNTTNPNTPN